VRALVVAVVLAITAVAVAAPPAGREQYERGARAFHEKRWAEARAAFAAAYDADHEPELLYDYALATRRQAEADGDRVLLAAARDAYQRYLDASPTVRRRPQAQDAIAAIEAQLPRATPPTPTAPTAREQVLDPWSSSTPAPVGEPQPPIDEADEPPSQANVPPPSTPPRPANVLAPPPAPAPDVVATSPAPAPRRRWVAPAIIVGCVVVVALAVGLGVGLSSSSSSSHPSLGTVTYP
jgi:hypothetical protein